MAYYSLQANHILQSIIGVIDNKSFWETYYETEKEELNLPKQDADEKISKSRQFR